MRVVIFSEGSYPFVVGGVASWEHMLIQSFSEHEFIVHAILPDRSYNAKYKYDFPENMIEIRESYLDDSDYIRPKQEKVRLNEAEKAAFRSLLFGEDVQWKELFYYFDRKDPSINGLLMGKDFLDIVKEFYREKYPQCVFTDLLWNMRSLYLPLFMMLKQPVAEADLYHTVSTGYAGILACKAKVLYNRPMLLTEHGIYSREREEEIIKVEWTKGIYKDIWIQYFYTLSRCAYDMADKVMSLFEGARKIQIELGCPEDKTLVVPNGVEVDQFTNLPQKPKTDPYINVGAVLRIVPIKDIKSMITAFAIAKNKVPNLKLFLMGPTEENPEYFQECVDMVNSYGLKDVEFTGRINVKEYLGKMDFTILTSISEGQPLSMLESMSAYKPCIATDVGACRELVYGNQDGCGEAGIVVPVMNTEKIAAAIVRLANHPDLCREWGFNGRKRVEMLYQKHTMIQTYRRLYQIGEKQDGWNRI